MLRAGKGFATAKTALQLTGLCVILFAGCRSIPTLVPDMAMRPPHPIQFDGSRGPLSAAQSRTILARMEKNGADTHIFDQHLALEAEIVGGPLMVGNQVDLLVDGPTTYRAMYAAIGQARDHINMETYIIEDDEIGRGFAELFVRKQRSGVQVNLLYDSVGSINTPKEFFQALATAGVNVLEFNPVNPLIAHEGWQVNRRDHRKLLIVDGQIAFVGGINISSVYSSGSFRRPHPVKASQPWRDTHLRMAGPVVADFQKLFFATWNQQKGAPLAPRNYYPKLDAMGDEVVRAIGSSPEEPYSQIYVTLLSALNSAKTEILLTNAYFVPDPNLLAALKEAVQRGVDVRLLLPDQTDSKLVFHASRSYYEELLTAGIRIHEHHGALLHAKTALIDGVWSTVGSTNLDWRSFLYNQEIDAVILGQNFGSRMRAMFENDLESSRPVLLETWRQRSIGARVKERVARLWAHWL